MLREFLFLLLLRGFSALQRAENSSIPRIHAGLFGQHKVSVLFSEPKIPQCVLVGV